VDRDLPFHRKVSGREVGVAIAEEEHALVEEEGGVPNRRRPAEHRQKHACEERLHQEEQGRADEDGERVKRRHGEQDETTPRFVRAVQVNC